MDYQINSPYDSQGLAINPATEENLTDTLLNYKLARLPVSGDTMTYLGYIRKDGAWYITEIDKTSGTAKYIKGDSDLQTSWSNRASLTYQDFNLVF